MNFKPEEQLQATIVSYLSYFPEWLVHHSPNENKLYSSVPAKIRAILIAKNQKLGVVGGYPDLILHGPNGRVYLIELKHNLAGLTMKAKTAQKITLNFIHVPSAFI